ncbi:hypothetical protein GGD56_006760 [Rhizobium mongolense]|uniref:Transposase of IS4/5 family DUF4096 n=1 Tax=Rhizobium mongolense TaxID=57676 RepID=A0ABR6IYB3_9HYPH|nr:hypothetical protein [Rhizobium mongolense]
MRKGLYWVSDEGWAKIRASVAARSTRRIGWMTGV